MINPSPENRELARLQYQAEVEVIARERGRGLGRSTIPMLSIDQLLREHRDKKFLCISLIVMLVITILVLLGAILGTYFNGGF